MVLGRDEVDRRKASGDIEVAPLAFMRGRTLSDAFVVIDEAQNATIPPHGVTSGLAHALSILKGIKGIDQIVFEASDVVRHPLVGKIVTAYEKDTKS